MQAVVSCLCTDPRSVWGEKAAAHPRLHPAYIYIYRLTEKAVDKHKCTSLFLLSKATGFSAKHLCPLNKRELTVLQGFLLKSKAHLSFCINVLEFSNSIVTFGVNEGVREVCLYRLHVYHICLDDGGRQERIIGFLLREEGN